MYVCGVLGIGAYTLSPVDLLRQRQCQLLLCNNSSLLNCSGKVECVPVVKVSWEFGYNEYPATRSRFLSIKIIDSSVIKNFGYNEHPLTTSSFATSIHWFPLKTSNLLHKHLLELNFMNTDVNQKCFMRKKLLLLIGNQCIDVAKAFLRLVNPLTKSTCTVLSD